MDIPQLAAKVAEILAPFLPYLILASEAATKEAGKKFGEAAWNEAVTLWQKLKPKVEEKPLLKEATEDLKANQEDEDAQATFRRQLTKLFEADVPFAQTIEDIYNSIVIGRDVINSQIAKGDGNTQQRAGDNSLQIGKIEINIEGGVYKGRAPRDPQEALNIYRGVMANSTKNLSLHGIDPKASDLNEQRVMGLANVYIGLNTTTLPNEVLEEMIVSNEKTRRRIEKESKPLPALFALIYNKNLVLKGDPGSGKSTFVNYLTYCLSSQLTDRLENWKKEDTDVLPVVVILRDFIKSFKKLPKKAEPKHIWDFIEKRLKDQNLSSSSKPISELLEQGKVILFFDGLDEVTTIPQRIFVRDAVMAFVKRYEKNRFVVTCRILSYTEPKDNEPDLRLVNFPEFEIAPFDNKQINSFINHWYQELTSLGMTKERADNLTENLLKQIRGRKELNKLAGNPLLLTIMAVVNTDEGQLPDTRAKLYETIIEKLLWQWEQTSKGTETARLRQLLQDANCSDADLKNVIWKLAYKAHAQTDVNSEDEEALAGVSELSLQKALAGINKNDLNWAASVIETMKLRAGLLLERENGVFTFPHRSFQEFLAGTYLESKDDFVARAKELAENQMLWRNVILWAVSRRVFIRGSLDSPLALIAELCPKRDLTEKEWSKVWLAGDVLLEVGVTRAERTELGSELVPQVQNKLVQLIEGNHLSPRERAEAGNTLAQLGDPRFDAETWHLPKEALYGFVRIPAGEFLMGTKEEDIKDLIEKFGGEEKYYKDETPQHTLHLPDFYMARYPVTVSQFRTFVEDAKYKPTNENSLRGVLNHPVVRVTWFDAIAYCQWLNKKLQEKAKQVEVKHEAEENFWKGITSGELIVTLPSEAEWEKSARGTDARLFSWEGEFDKEKANVEMNIGNTSTVGSFPHGKSFYELQDTTGNVWEWARSIYKPYKYISDDGRENMEDKKSRRVLRGGSFYYDRYFVRCAYRYLNFPYLENLSIGFRICVSSIAPL